jgi:2-C-methyl-D-erythritol 2,4-cyclodiphosphate synthase
MAGDAKSYNLAKPTRPKCLMNRNSLRIGIGHDTHRLVPGGPLILGGISIPFEMQLLGHSDADVLLHAVTDALLGAAGLGDIGEHFPDTLPVNRNRSSIEMLQQAMSIVRKHGLTPVNLDCIVFAERPKLSPHKESIRDSIAQAIGIDPDCVNVKAKTGEQIGIVGSQQCIQAQCVALLSFEPS